LIGNHVSAIESNRPIPQKELANLSSSIEKMTVKAIRGSLKKLGEAIKGSPRKAILAAHLAKAIIDKNPKEPESKPDPKAEPRKVDVAKPDDDFYRKESLPERLGKGILDLVSGLAVATGEAAAWLVFTIPGQLTLATFSGIGSAFDSIGDALSNLTIEAIFTEGNEVSSVTVEKVAGLLGSYRDLLNTKEGLSKDEKATVRFLKQLAKDKNAMREFHNLVISAEK